MKTLGFGIKSLLKDPQWAMKHGINPYNQTQGSIVGDGKVAAANDKINSENSVKNRAQKGDIGSQNNIFSQENLNKLNGVKPEEKSLAQRLDGIDKGGSNIFEKMNKIDGSQRIDGIDKDNTSIFDRMNKLDESHKMLAGANNIQNDPLGVNQPNMEDIQKKLGKKLNILM